MTPSAMGMPPNHEPSQGPPVGSWHEPVLNLLCDLASRKMIIGVCAGLGVIAGAVRYARTPPFYRATAVAVLLPREKPIIDSSLDLGTVRTENDAAVRATSGTLMLPPNPDLYIELINSRAVMESLVQRFGPRLPGTADAVESDDAIAQLRRAVVVKGSLEGMLTITVTSDDRRVSADLANAILEECESASKKIERQLILQQAGYLEGAVSRASKSVDAAQTALVSFAAEHRLVDPTAESLESLRMIREAATAKEGLTTKLRGLLISRTEKDPEVRRLRGELAAISENLNVARDNMGGSSSRDSLLSLMVEHEGLKQQLRFRRDMLGTLEAQANIFRLRAEQPAGSLAVVRVATSPDSPAGPSRKEVLGVPLFAGFALGVLAALLHAQWTSLRRSVELTRVSDRLIVELVPSSIRRWRVPLTRTTGAAP